MIGHLHPPSWPLGRSSRPGAAAGARPGPAAAPTRLPLVYDTDAPGLPAGIRAVVWDGARHLLFAADEHELLLRVGPPTPDGACRVLGEVLRHGEPLAGARVRLLAAAPGPWARTDEDGAFDLQAATARGCHIQVATDRGLLETAPLAIQSRR